MHTLKFDLHHYLLIFFFFFFLLWCRSWFFSSSLPTFLVYLHSIFHNILPSLSLFLYRCRSCKKMHISFNAQVLSSLSGVCFCNCMSLSLSLSYLAFFTFQRENVAFTFNLSTLSYLCQSSLIPSDTWTMEKSEHFFNSFHVFIRHFLHWFPILNICDYFVATISFISCVATFIFSLHFWILLCLHNLVQPAFGDQLRSKSNRKEEQGSWPWNQAALFFFWRADWWSWCWSLSCTYDCWDD